MSDSILRLTPHAGVILHQTTTPEAISHTGEALQRATATLLDLARHVDTEADATLILDMAISSRERSAAIEVVAMARLNDLRNAARRREELDICDEDTRR